MFPHLSRLLSGLCIVLIFSSCISTEEMQKRQAAKAEAAKFAALKQASLDAHAAFRAKKGWKARTYRDDAVLALAKPENLSVQISIADQRGLLWVDQSLGMNFPVATGRKSHPTPTGDYKILVKELSHKSNLYGKIVDAAGNVTVENADATQHKPAEGETFEGAPMPNFMRLSNDGVGMHVGYVPGHPASHGCIRLPRKVAVELYGMLKIGTPVTVAERIEFAAPPAPAPVKKKL